MWWAAYFPCLCSAESVGSDADDAQEVFDASEVVDVARLEGQVGG